MNRSTKRLIERLMAIPSSRSEVIDGLTEAGFEDSGYTMGCCEYMILQKNGVRILYDETTDSIISYYEVLRKK